MNRLVTLSLALTVGMAPAQDAFRPWGGAEYPHRAISTAIEAYHLDWSALPPWTTYQYRGREVVPTFAGAALTTPISYLTRMPVDVFSVDEMHWTAYASAAAGGQTLWLIWSAGPDGDYDFPYEEALGAASPEAEALAHQWSYHATNGTISSGDLITVGR
jgi:hypothetical protein